MLKPQWLEYKIPEEDREKLLKEFEDLEGPLKFTDSYGVETLLDPTEVAKLLEGHSILLSWSSRDQVYF